MVKMPNLERKEVERIVEALDYYCAILGSDPNKDAAEYARLAEILKRRAHIPLT